MMNYENSGSFQKIGTMSSKNCLYFLENVCSSCREMLHGLKNLVVANYGDLELCTSTGRTVNDVVFLRMLLLQAT